MIDAMKFDDQRRIENSQGSVEYSSMSEDSPQLEARNSSMLTECSQSADERDSMKVNSSWHTPDVGSVFRQFAVFDFFFSVLFLYAFFLLARVLLLRWCSVALYLQPFLCYLGLDEDGTFFQMFAYSTFFASLP